MRIPIFPIRMISILNSSRRSAKFPGIRGNFLEVPGHFEFSAQSYCHLAGTYPPRKADGFLYAPLKGPRAAVISRILRESVRHPEIDQHTIQLLLWGILAKAKVVDMPAPVKSAAYAFEWRRSWTDSGQRALANHGASSGTCASHV